MKALNQIVAVGILMALPLVARCDDSGSDGGGSQTQINLSRQQRVDWLRLRREREKSCSGRMRDEVREQVIAIRMMTSSPVRQEFRQSLEDAKRQSIEQSRKLISETGEIARQSRHAQ